MLAPQESRTFFVTTNCYQRQPVFRNRERAELMLAVLQDNRAKGRFVLHEFVVMEDHLHLMLTPAHDVSLEKAVQYIKGGFSFRVKKELRYQQSVWQASFTEHRIKDVADYDHHANYIRMNPVNARLASLPEKYPFSSAADPEGVDACPPWLKPGVRRASARA